MTFHRINLNNNAFWDGVCEYLQQRLSPAGLSSHEKRDFLLAAWSVLQQSGVLPVCQNNLSCFSACDNRSAQKLSEQRDDAADAAADAKSVLYSSPRTD